jgi:hypothetical protein
MNTLDSDLIAWRRQWHEMREEVPAPDLPGRAARELRRSLLGLIPPALITLIVGGGLAWRAANTGSPADVASAVGAWSFIGIAWAGSLWLGRGTWRPRNESTAAFVDLSIARCTGWIRALPFALALYVAELVFVLGFVGTLRNPARTVAELLVSGPALVLGWIGLPGLVAAALWWRRTLSARRDRLYSLRQQLTEG